MSTQAFGERLRELRKARWLTQRGLAEIAGVDFTYLSKLELGIPGYSPSSELIHNLATLLETDENELINLAGKLPPGLREMMKDKPLLTELVRVLSERVLPEETYRKLLELAREDRV